ncbi:LOW QUALITY PROTEIN: unconventional myosin-IXb [Aplochiton taeniatus]
MSQTYSLLEVREKYGEERTLDAGDRPVARARLWPPKAQGPHPQSQGYHFIIQRQSDGETAQHREDEEDFDDLCNLPTLSGAILQTLHRRFYKQKIYTYASRILIAINPFKFLPIYNPKYVKMYENQPLGKLSPHIFAVADVTYHTMLRKQANQCIVISGESGSGKTQSTNFLIHCLTALSQKGYSSGVERTILGAGPVLEAFGNSKTAQNNNSSRFGKFIQINYLESGVVRGAVVEKYLLEKCRLVCREQSERNYHVFYYLLVGASKEEQGEFHLLQPQDYYYLRQKDFHLEDEEDLRHEFKRLHQAMEMVGFLPPTKKQIFSVLSAILYLGNVTYTLSDDGHVVEVGPAAVLSTLSDLLKVKKLLLVEALTKRRTTTANDTLVLHYTLQQATTARDSMAKSLYSSLFDWIVLHINHALLNIRDMEDSVSCLSIGILDIFGFEDFKLNSFEQFCINYANEKLHHYFNQQIFKLEQEEYKTEGIPWHNIVYTDNMECILLISKKPTGLFHLLDEESNLSRATDETLLDKLKHQHQNNPYFIPTTVMEPAFVVQHFAGRVKYQIKDFREKNTDHMRPDIVSLLRSSERVFLRRLIGSSPVAVFRWGILRATIHILSAFKEAGRRREETGLNRRRSRPSLKEIRSRSHSAIERLSSPALDFSFDRSQDHPLEVFEDIFASYENRKKSRGNRQKQLIPKNLMDSRSLKHIVSLTLHDRTTQSILHPHQKKKPPSIGAQFQASLNKLLETVGKAEPFFVRCIRSNAEKTEMHFDDELVLQQVKYTGLLETVRIQKSGYSAKFIFKDFVERFRVLLPKEATATPEVISKLLQKIGLEKSTYQIGNTMVFLKEQERQHLLDLHNKEVMRNIIILQRWFRACLIRKHFQDKRDAVTIIQRCWRGFCEEKRCQAAIVIQEAWRGSYEREEYLRQRTSIKKLNALVRNRTGDKRDESEGQTVGSKRERTNSDLQRRLDKKDLQRQQGLDPSPNRSQPPEPIWVPQNPSSPEMEKEDWTLNRPFSVPLDSEKGRSRDSTNPSSYYIGCLQRYTKTDEEIKEMADRWKEKRQAGDSSPKVRRPRNMKMEELRNKGMSMSVDDISNFSTSESDGSPTSEDKVRLRRRRKHKRRLAYARSGLMFDYSSSKESEYWSFPLPPMSPLGSSVKRSSRVDGQPSVSQVKYNTLPTATDGTRLSVLVRNDIQSSSHQRSSQLTTPERLGFLSKILKRRPRDSQTTETSPQKGATSPTHSLYSDRASIPNSDHLQRNPTIKISRATRAEQWNASLEREITETKELHHLDEFLGNQVNDLKSRTKELSGPETVFVTATMQFRDTLKNMYSISNPRIAYKSLMMGYQNKVASLAGPKQNSDIQLVVNLFQSVLDGFIRGEVKREEAEPIKSAKKPKKRKKDPCPNSPLGHMFSTYQVNIMQSCDLCGSYIWGMEKAYMCGACKMVCHKKCLAKIITACSTRYGRKDKGVTGLHHFGVDVCVLTSKTNPLPMVVEILLSHVEMNGLYTEGIYRKSGSALHARELYQLLETGPESVSVENYGIHTITGLVKRWLRELPDPLITYSLYNDFLQAVELPEKSERLRAVYKKLEELPPANYNTLERLIFHLVRVAKEEEHNRMNSNSLAIVFAPCIMRSPDMDDPFLGMKDVSKTTLCVEILINEQFRSYNEKMKDIQQLEYAEALAVNQLKLKRQNTVLEKPSELGVPGSTDFENEDERNLMERIRSIKQIKEDLASRLPDLEQENSDSDNLDSQSCMSLDSLVEERSLSLDSEGRTKMTLNMQVPECPPKPADLAERMRSTTGLIDGQNVRTPAESQPTRRKIVTQSLCIIPGQDHCTGSLSRSTSTNKVQGKSFDESYDDLDIPYIDEDD